MKRVFFLSLVSLMLLLCVPLAGCDSDEGLTAEEIGVIIEGVGDSEFNTCTFDMDIDGTVQANIGGNDMKIELDGGSEGSIDTVNQAMHIPFDITATIPFLGDQGISVEIYVVDGWAYMKMDGDWTKMELPEEVLGEQNQSSLIGQLTNLLALVDINSKGTEKINGVDCYKLHMAPDLGDLAEAALQQLPQSEIGDVDLSGLEDIVSSFTVDFTFWVAKEGYQLMRVNGVIDGELSSEDIPDMEIDFGNISVDVELDIVFDYNKDVNIVLPTEASQAVIGDIDIPFL